MLGELVKNFLEREVEEIRQNKARVAALFFCVIAGIILSVSNFGEDAEVVEVENAEVAEKNSTPEKVPEKVSDVQKVSDENVTPVIGANSETLFVKNPFKTFAVKEEIEDDEVEEPEKTAPEKIIEYVQVPAPAAPEKNPADKVAETFVLTGTMISGESRTALVELYKNKKLAGTLILHVGDTLSGKIITEITEDFVTFASGEKLYID